MRKYLIFFGVFLLINSILTFLFLRMMQESQLIISDGKMNAAHGAYENLVAGNSHGLALQDAVFDQSLNVSSYAETIQNSYFKIRHLVVEKEIKVKRLILSYDLGFLEEIELDNQSYQFYWNKYEVRRELFQFSDAPATFIFNRILAFCFPYKDGEVDAFDYLFATEKSAEAEMLREQTRLGEKATLTRTITDECLQKAIKPSAFYYFQKIIDLCKSQGIELVLIRYPVTPAYYISKSMCYDPEDFYELIALQTSGGMNGVKVLDFHDLYDVRSFRDGHHLNAGEIRVAFSRLVKDSLSGHEVD